MKSNNFDLYRAIYDVYNQFELEDKKPRSSDWFIYRNKRKLLKTLVIENLISMNGSLYSEEEILKAWDDFGKNKHKCKMLVENGLNKLIF